MIPDSFGLMRDPKSEATGGAPGGPQLTSNYVTAMSHFYRGEIGRIMAWRARLDATTTWAITATTTIFTVAFTLRELPHIVFFFNIAIVWMLLWIEARRYRYYDAFRARVRMLEAHFLVPILMQDSELLQGEWQKLVAGDLLIPSYKISRLEAIARRLKHNYAFIFVIILVAWTTKIVMHGDRKITSLTAFYEAMAVKHIPSWLVAATFFGTFVTIIGLTLYISRKAAREISEFGGSHRELWHI
jgi:uncharacterized membrane protein